MVAIRWSGPLPPPALRREHDEIVPGTAAEIMAVFGKSAPGRIDIADRLAKAEIETARNGLSLAFCLTLLAFAASIMFFALGNEVAGIAFLSLPVVMLIRSFLPWAGDHDRPGDAPDHASDA